MVGLLGLSTLAAAGQPDWRQWRGNNRDAQVTGPAWPDGLSTQRLTQLWRKDLGPSYSGPIIASNRVFVTETRDKKTEHVRALDLLTGQQLWEQSWAGATDVPWIGASGGSWIRSTPACDGPALFVLGMRDVLVALDTASGKELWRIDFPKQFGSPVPDFGGVSSPLVDGPHLYLQAGSGLVKIDKATGNILWRVVDDGGGKSKNGAFSSVALASLAGTRQLLVQGRQNLAGIDPADGTILWKTAVPAMFGMNILTPLAHSNTVFTSNLGGTVLFGIGTNQPPTVSTLWRNKLVGEMSSPVLIDGHLYTHLRNGPLVCLELATGKQLWSSKTRDQYLSMVANGARLLVLTDNGLLRLVAANPAQYELLGEVPLTKLSTWAHLAVSGDLVLVRDLGGLTVYRWK